MGIGDYLTHLFQLESWLQNGSQLLCHPFLLVLQIQGCIILSGLSLGWAYATRTRTREWKRLQGLKKSSKRPARVTGVAAATNGHHVANGAEGRKHQLPMVSVVMPVKGLGEHSFTNWRTQVSAVYEGPLEFLFVVESTKDPAHSAISQLIEELKGKVDVRLVDAGWAKNCSQKIYNQLAGVRAMDAASKYVFFLDDDVRLYPSTISTFVAIMEEDPKSFMVTGYPFDVPSSTLASYCAKAFHLPLSVGFATAGRTTFVWGGLMMMQAADWRSDRYGMVTAMGNGGYSDDMILTAVAGDNRCHIYSPASSIFFHPLGEDFTMQKYWNYLRRQIFVLETYSSVWNQLVNRALYVVHCWLSWGLVIPVLPSAVHLAATAVSTLVSILPPTLKRLQPFVPKSTPSSCPAGAWAAGAVAVSFAVAALSLYRMAYAVVRLGNLLAEDDHKAPRVSMSAFKWHKMWLGMLVGNFLYPVCAVITSCKLTVEWSGVRYSRWYGKVAEVHRPKGTNGTDKGAESPSKKRVSILGQLARLLSWYLCPRQLWKKCP